jgi:uncharacterized protein
MAQGKLGSANGSGSFKQPERMTLIALVGLTAVLFSLLLLLFYLVPYYGFSRIHSDLPWVMGSLLGGFGIFVLFALALLSVAIFLGHDVPFSRKLRSVAIKILLPVLTMVGKLIGLRKEDVQHAFVAVNNELVLTHCRNGHPPQKILMLMPHCLQDRDCPVKVTHKVENCKRCGKCGIKDLLELTERYGVDLAVATGGTIARRIVMEKRPDLIIAVACERDLTSGIQDTTPLPVYGIFNERPFGPCLNTRVSLDRVESILKEVTSMRREGA